MARVDQQDFYKEHYDTHGTAAQGVAWENAQTQRKRFGVITSCLGDLRGVSVVDAGCGFGDLYLFLKERCNLPKSYVGLDLCAPMVAEARVRTGCQILQKDILRQSLPMADWYVASGSMNLLTRMETQLFIQRCFAASRKGFVFNLLEGREEEGAFAYWNTHDVFTYCRTLTPNVQLKEGYMQGDMTVVMRA